MQSECPSPIASSTVDAGTTADISGVTVEDGVTTGTGTGGGGILNDGTLEPVGLDGHRQHGEPSGGGVYLEAGAATLTNVTVDSNTTGGDGGGVYVADGTNVISGGSIDNNTVRPATVAASYIENVTSPATRRPSPASTITATPPAGTAGGLYVQNDSDTSNNPVTFTNATIDDNTPVRTAAASTCRTTAAWRHRSP